MGRAGRQDLEAPPESGRCAADENPAVVEDGARIAPEDGMPATHEDGAADKAERFGLSD